MGMAKGDFVEVLVDAGGGSAREYTIEATRAGRNGGVVRTARFVAPRVLAVVEHPKAA